MCIRDSRTTVELKHTLPIPHHEIPHHGFNRTTVELKPTAPMTAKFGFTAF